MDERQARGVPDHEFNVIEILNRSFVGVLCLISIHVHITVLNSIGNSKPVVPYLVTM
jgi:hypothetical protein